MRQISFDPSIPWALWVPLALAAAGLLAWYAVASRGRLARRRRPGVLMLMTLVVALPLAVLLNPTWLERIPPPAGKPLLTILVDRSASMATTDAEDGRTRYELAGRIASEAADRLNDTYEIRVRCFADDGSLVAPEQLSRKKPDGPVTDLALAIDQALDDQHPQGQAILLLSDGIHNAGGGMDRLRRSVARANALAAPLYVRTIGGPTGASDLEVSLDRPRELAFVGQRVPVAVRLQQRGSLGVQTKLTLALDGKVVQERPVQLTPDGNTEESFELAQVQSGLYRYEVRADPLSGEVTTINNTATLLLRVVDEPVRVLLLEGKPYWDTKFLIRTLSRDPSVELVSVVKMAEGRLLERRISRAAVEAAPLESEVRGVPAASPPLAPPAAARDAAPGAARPPEGLESDGQDPAGPKDDDQQDRPPRTEEWTVRKDAGEILSDPETLNSYQIVVLGRDAEAFLSEPTLVGLEKWLKQRECSLVCFRGAPASQISQRLGRLMPVRWTPSGESRFRVEWTPSGRNLRWLPFVEEERAGLAALPSLATMAQSQPREVAETLAETVSGADAAPAITYLRVGMGRVVVVEGAGMWRWAFLPPQYQKHDQTYDLLWRSLMRWLVADVELLPSQRLALKPEKITFTTGENATADLLIREEHLGEQTPEVELTGDVLEEPRRITPVAAGTYPGQFRVAFGRLPEGRYQARVLGAGDEEISARAAFDVRRGHLEEVLEVEASPERMGFLAAQSGGAVLASTDPSQLARQFDQHLARTRPERTVQTTAWDRWWVLAAAFAVWAGAWGFRRYSGLV